MAARSPIVLDSSSVPPETPHHHYHKSSAATSSSPALPSISKLIRQTAPRSSLVSDSQAQGLSVGVTTGFASAGSIWKAQSAEIGHKHKGDQDEDISDKRRLAYGVAIVDVRKGKLPERQTSEGVARTSRRPSVTAESPLSAFAYQKAAIESKSVSASPIPATRSGKLRDIDQERRVDRIPSVLSIYDFPREGETVAEVPFEPVDKPAKKPRKSRAKAVGECTDVAAKNPRKKPAKSAKTAAAVPEKRSRKPLKKSESVILNSDDLAATQAQTYSRIEVSGPPARVPRAKKTKAQGGSTRTENNIVAVFTNSEAVHATSKRSAYFGATTVENDGSLHRDSEVLAIVSPSVAILTKDDFPGTPRSPAPRRRLSWTPAKKCDSLSRQDAAEASPSALDEQGSPKKSLADLVSGLGYTSKNASATARPARRSVSGEALTKRRRIELADESTLGPAQRKASPEPVTVPRKKVKTKAPKKKPQTITELATKGYRVSDEEVSVQPTVSEFFSAQKPVTTGRPEDDLTEKVVKVKKPRKLRTKRMDCNGIEAVSSKATKAKKAKKVKINEVDCLAELYTPYEARVQERSQDFLFGTSSQLAVEESPTFIREMQFAMRDSEALSASQIDNPKSRRRVPTATEGGTKLSVNQAYHDLWCNAARDTGGDVMRLDSATIRIVRTRENRTTSCDLKETVPVIEEARQIEDAVGTGATKSDTPVVNAAAEQEVVDLCRTSPAAAENVLGPAQAIDANSKTPVVSPLPSAIQDSKTADSGNADGEPKFDDKWSLFGSDDSHPTVQDIHVPRDAPVVPSPSKLSPSRISQLRRSATSPSRQRSVLQDLDANISLHTFPSHDRSVASTKRTMTTGSDSCSPPKRGRGRPRKHQATTATTEYPETCGRAAKQASLLVGETTLMPRIPGMGKAYSASQPTASGASDWANIDEISDSDSPNTPSPPRIRAASSPPEMPSLDFEVSGSPPLETKVSKSTSALIKPGDPYFTTVIQPILFPQITKTVKSTPPSEDMQNPTWYEKILLYDPIVLEDFTAWLNSQGLRYEVQKVKAKAKTKGRKKKDAPLVSEDPEYEIVREELKPWMTQKWCEEKSVCCLWKEGLRGGVRTRY